MKFAASLSTHPEPAVAAGEVIGELTEALTELPDLALVFVSGKRVASLPEIVDAVHSLVMPHTLLAVTACGTLGGAQEVETGDSVSVWAGCPGQLTPIRLEVLPGLEPIITGLPTTIEPGSVLLLLAEPFTFDPVALTHKLELDYPGVLLCGGIASAGGPGANRLWLDDAEFSDGAVGVIFPPGVAAPMVSQGCRPIGQPWVVTESRGNIVEKLGNDTAMSRLKTTLEELDDDTRQLAANGLLLGIVAADQAEEPEVGDFLVRGIQGGDSKTGAIAVGAEIEVGQLVQFQIRDVENSTDDLAQAIVSARRAGDYQSEAALVFTCNGRGIAMFGKPNHDAQTISELIHGPVAGMFCAGELGPIAGRNAVHTFTATALLVRSH